MITEVKPRKISYDFIGGNDVRVRFYFCCLTKNQFTIDRMKSSVENNQPPLSSAEFPAPLLLYSERSMLPACFSQTFFKSV